MSGFKNEALNRLIGRPSPRQDRRAAGEGEAVDVFRARMNEAAGVIREQRERQEQLLHERMRRIKQTTDPSVPEVTTTEEEGEQNA